MTKKIIMLIKAIMVDLKKEISLKKIKFDLYISQQKLNAKIVSIIG